MIKEEWEGKRKSRSLTFVRDDREEVEGATLLRRSFGVQVDLLQRAEEKEPGGGAEEGDESGEEESVEKSARVLDEKAGDDGSRDAGKVADEILQAGPLAGSARASENLRDDPGVGNVEAVSGSGE